MRLNEEDEWFHILVGIIIMANIFLRTLVQCKIILWNSQVNQQQRRNAIL